MKRLYGSIATILAALLITTGCPAPQTPDDEEPTEEPAEEHEEEHEEHEDEDGGVVGLVGTAQMINQDGEPMGEVVFTQLEEGLQIEGRLESVEPGPRGFHAHEHGVCDPPDFESAGGHFNPQGHPHGSPEDPDYQRHVGDFGNIEFDEDGVAEFSFVDDIATLGDGTNDVAGQSLIVHHGQDDLETQPTGDAGPRAGCGIIEIVH